MYDRLTALWLRARDGDQRAFGELQAEMLPRLWGLLRKKGALESDLEDLAQETWLRAFKGSKTFDPDRRTFHGWMFAIAVNVRFNTLRTERRRLQPNPLPDEGLAGTGPLPEDCLFALERTEQLYLCMEQLEPLSRTIIFLRFWAELEFKAIEEKLGKAALEIKRVYMRGIRKLFKCMELLKNGKD